MTEDELMQLIIKSDPRPDVPELYAISGVEYRHFERFAALVAAHEREACAKVCETVECGNGMMIEERHTAQQCAAAIRKRGET